MKRLIVAVLSAAVIAAALPPAAGYWVFREVERRLDLRMTGDFVPVFFYPGFLVRNARFRWQDRVELLSGTLEVRYAPWSVFAGPLLRICLSSRGASIRLGGEWARMQGVEQAMVDVFEAELGLGPKGIREIYALEVRSPSFQFHVQKSDNHQ
ncbi:MAG: hypothetical protein WC352_00180 [Candidatus Omnitrophota bacterium]|jgi:hypothetical protein